MEKIPMFAKFARVHFGPRLGVIEFGVTTPANPTRRVLSLFARSLDSGPWGWAVLATFYALDLAEPFALVVSSIRFMAGKRTIGWWTGKSYRGRKPRFRGVSSWSKRINHANHPAVVASRWPPSRARCPF